MATHNPLSCSRDSIRQTVRRIPPGRVATYGEVAALAGLPGRARLVGRSLGQDDGPPLPWHRVVAAGGRIALPEGSDARRASSTSGSPPRA